MPATIVDQLTPYTCSLACLESYFTDIQKPLSQADMLKQHYGILQIPDPQHRHEYGSADDGKIIGICTALGFSPGLYMDFRQAEVEKAFSDALTKKHGVMIMAFWNNQTNHCVRLAAIKLPGLYEVMCPVFPKSQLLDVTFPQLVSWAFRFLIVS
jgi:hypothetical protein